MSVNTVAIDEIEREDENWAGLIAPGRRVVTTLLTLTTALFAFSEFFVSAAVPSAVEEFGQAWLLPWSFIVFLVASITCAAAAASFKRRFGARSALVLANLVFILGCFFAITSTGPVLLLTGRAFQGAGEGLALAVAYTLIPQVYSGGLIARVFGLESVVWATAAFTAPAAAGALTQFVSWRSPFSVSIPIAIMLLLLSLFVPGQKDEAQDGATPWWQLLLIAAAMLAMSVTSMTDMSWSAVLLVVALVFAVTFFRIDRRSASRILPVGDGASQAVLSSGLWIIFLMPVAAAAGSVYFIYGLMEALGYEPLAASLVRSLLAISWSLTAFAVSNMRARRRESNLEFAAWLLVLGYATLTLSFVLHNVVLAALGQVVVGISFGLTWGPLSQILMERAPSSERDRTTALLPMLQSAGFAVGGAIFGLVANLSGIEDGAEQTVIDFGLLTIFALGTFIATSAGVFSWRLSRSVRLR